MKKGESKKPAKPAFKGGLPAAETRTVTVGGQAVTYQLTRKRVRNFNLRVRSDGSVAVSAPLRIPGAAIDEFVARHGAFLTKARARVAERQEDRTEGDRLSVFGREITVRAEQGSANRAFFDESAGILTLTLTDPANGALVRAAIEAWEKRFLEQAVRGICVRAAQDYAGLGVDAPTIRFRGMTSRWGSCHTVKRSITFSYSLIRAPLTSVEYVVYHEFAHLLHPNHSPAFHAQVAAFLPDWKLRRAALRNTPCRFP